MPTSLVIVESPAKAKKIAEYLGAGYLVEASVGHIRDLPHGAADIPEEYKGLPWANTGVDTENDFKPLYIVPKEKREQVKKLKALLKQSDQLFLATDEDREGESISWHLLEVLGPKVPVRRMVFHEITKKAIQDAVANPRDLDMPLVDAQETRRILDRLYGYEVSPVLWRKVLPRLSAGRVQSVATRIVVERERERMAFRSASYWGIDGTFRHEADAEQPAFPGTLVALDGQRVATGRDFDQQGTLRQGVTILDEAGATGLVAALDGAAVAVRSVDEKPYRSSPKPPFMTSTLQQEGGRKLRFSSQRTMQVAQRLYENGYITYMRTDSTSLSPEAVAAARAQAAQLYGPQYVPTAPRTYNKKVKNAQEAHEAIRPAGETFRTPDEVKGEVGPDEARLYELIWKRTVASQMADATGVSVTARMGATASDGRDAEFSASGRTITFPGYLRAYVEGSDDPEGDLEDRETFLPPLAVGDSLGVDALAAEGHSTSPPARYTEASLVRRLEDLGVGRPSTYASIMGTIQDRGYVWKKGTALVPTWTAFAVIGLLEVHFTELVDYQFTAKLEDDLDAIASQEAERIPYLRDFYFGHGDGDGHVDGLKAMTSERAEAIDPREVNSIPIAEGIVLRVGKFGPYLQRGDERATVPDGIAPDELTAELADQLLAKGQLPDEPIGTDPETGLPVYVKTGRFGDYVQLGELVDGAKDKPKRSSLFKYMTPESLTLDEALQLLSLPRLVGLDPATGEEITAQNGKFGPYLRKGTDSRTLTDANAEDKLLTIGLDEALAIYAAPKYGPGSRRGAAKPPLADFGPDPVTEKPMVVKEGRFGVYLTDGETNVTLKGGDTAETLDAGRAAELLAEKRAKGPAVKKGAKKATAAKKAPAAKKAGSTSKKAGGVAKKAGGTAKKAGGVAKKAGGVKKAVAKKPAPSIEAILADPVSAEPGGDPF